MQEIICAERSASGQLIEVKYPSPDQDINGIGVILAFTIGVYAAWILAVVAYVCRLVPPRLLNQCDTLFVGVRPRVRHRDHVDDLDRAVLAFADQQLVACIGIPIAGLVKISEASVFDFQTIIYLGWLSSNMFLTAVSTLHEYFHPRPWARSFRVAGMLCTMVLICATLYPTSWYAWQAFVLWPDIACPNAANCPALSKSATEIWDHTKQQVSVTSIPSRTGITYFVLILGHVWQAAKLFRPIHCFLMRWCRKPLEWLEWWIAKQRAGGRSYRLLAGIYMILLAVLDWTGSHVFTLNLMLFSIGYGSFHLLTPRYKTIPSCVRDKLNEWSYGQILPMLLLLGPLLGVVSRLIEARGAWSTRASGRVLDERSVWHPENGTNTTPRTIPAMIKQLACATSDRSQRNEMQVSLHQKLYSVVQFRMIMGLLMLYALLMAVSFFVWTYVGYVVAPWSYAAWTKEWLLSPIAATGGAGAVIFLVVSLVLSFVGSGVIK
ncbi:hypothetical protein FDECE_7407 [Fusarium decemcellulare]|nr:hypothetical protein FDECE_7407 [Fusarium decemcellulare]